MKISFLQYIKQLCLTVFLGISALGYTQTLPVDAFLQLNAPYSIYYSDYYTPSSDLIQATFIFQDFNEPSWDIRLRLVIESSDVRLSTKSEFIPLSAINLTPGVPVTVEGSDWDEYFNLDNVDISGITREELAMNGKLPEGFYRFSIEALDYETGKELSRESQAVAWLSLGEAPLVVWPQCGSVVPAEDPQNILFQWQDRNVTSSNLDEINYKLYLYEITDDEVDPIYALDNGQTLLIYESEDLLNTSLQYDLAMTTLETGKKYLFRVQIYDPFDKYIFKNDGYSENCWFYYGFPSDGNIDLEKPSDEFKFASDDPRTFAWSAPDKLMDGQFFEYKLKIIEAEVEGDLEDQLIDESAWHLEETLPTSSLNSWALEISKPFDEQKYYAWQVTAHSDGQQIAKSEIRGFYGPSLIDYFMAGQHKVIVKSLDNNDLTDLKGVGEVKLLSSDGDSVLTEVNFEGLHIINIAGRYVLEEGEIIHELPNYKIELTPYLEENNNAIFTASQLKLDKNSLSINGEVKWPLPHPTLSDEVAYLTSSIDWINFDSYKLFGVTKLISGNDFELLDPFGFRLDFHESSDIEINKNVFELRLDGDIYLPKSVHNVNNERVSFAFQRAEQLYYFEEEGFEQSSEIALVDNTQLYFAGTSAIIDLSEKESPVKLADDKEWKGVYFYNFDVTYPKLLDDKSQLVFEKQDQTAFELNMSNDFKAWVTTEGITTYFHDKFDYGSTGTFNGFSSVFTSFEVDVEHNAVTDSDFKGSNKIPVFDAHADFTFTIPMSNGGFEPGYLDQSLEHSTFVFSPYGGENRVDITIQKAVFVENERLDLIVDIKIPYIEVEMTEVADLRVYGDNYIGFGKKNGAQDLAEQVEGSYDGFTIYLDKIGCGLSGSEYIFSYSATMPLGDEMSGEEGAPRVDIYSSSPAGDDVAKNVNESSAPAMDMVKPELASADPQQLSIDSMSIEIKSEIIDCFGYLILTKNDPTWGTSMQGGLTGDLKMPAKISLGTNMILGTKDNMKYWYMDAWFVDYEGTGIPVFNMFNIVAFEGKIYRHMSMNMDESESSDKPAVVIDPSVEFGAGLYMQLIDTQGGQQFKADVGLELVVETEHFTVGMTGDISLLNSEGRSNASLSNLAKDIAAEEAAKAAAKAILAVVDVDFEFDLGSGKTVGVKADASYGKFQFDDSGSGFILDGDVSATPSAGLTVYSGSQSVAIKGSVDGQGSVAIESGDDRINLGYYETDGASLELSTGGVELDAAFNKTNGYGAFKLGYDQKLIDVAVNKEEGTGHIELAFDEGKRIYVAGDAEGSGEFELQYDDVFVTLKGDRAENAGELGVQVGGEFINAKMNQSQGTGALAFKFGDVEYDLTADKTGKADMTVQIEEDLVHLLVDKPEGRGEIEVEVDGNRVAVMLDQSGKGTLEIETASLKLGVSAEKEAGAGSFLFDDGNVLLDVGANKSEGSGYVIVETGADSVIANVSSEGRELKMSIDGTYFAVQSSGDDEGSITLMKGVKSIEVGANTTDQSGFVKLKNGDDLIEVSANKTEKTGEFKFELDGVAVLAGRNTEDNYFSYSDATVSFSGTGNSTKGEFGFKEGENEISIGLDKSESSGNLAITTSDFAISTTLGLASKVGSLEVEADGNKISLEITEEKKSIGFERSQTSVSATAFVSGDKELLLNQDGYKVEYGYKSTVHSISLEKDGLGVALNSTKQVTLSFGSNEFTTVLDGSNFSITKNGTALQTALANSGNGTVNFSDYTDGQLNLTLEASNGTYTFAYAGNLKIGFDTDGNKTVELTADEKYVLTLSSSNQLTMERGTQKLFIDPVGELALENGSNQKFSITEEKIQTKFNSYEVDLTTSSIDFTDGTNILNLSPDKAQWIQGDKRISLSKDQEFELATSATQSVILSPQGAAFTYEEIAINIGNDAGLTYADADRSFAFSNTGLSLEEGENSLAINSDKSIEMSSGTDKSFKVGEEGLAMKYYDKEIAFGTNKSLSYKDNDRSIDLASTGLKYEEGDNILQVLDEGGERSLVLAKGDKSFTYQSGAATIIDGSNSLILGGDSYFALDYSGKQITVGENELKYQEGERLIAFGGDNFVEVKEGERGIKFTKEKEMVLEDGDRMISVSADKKISATDGTRTIALGGDDLVNYSDADNTVRLYNVGAGYGFGVARGDYEIALEGGKDMDATLVATAGEASVAVSSDKSSNVTATFGYADQEFELKTGQQGVTFSGGATEELEEVTTENLEGSAEVDIDGPQYIGMVTDGADGRAKGHIEMYYNSQDEHFIANASVTSVAPPCVQAAMAVEASPETWKIDIGTETERIEIYPSCSGFGGGGWLNLRPESVNVGVFAGFSAGASIDIVVAEVGADIWAELGVRAMAELEPTFLIKEAGVWVEVGVEVWVDPAIGSKFVVAGVYLRGELMIYFEDQTTVEGSLEGKVTICGISESFKMGFNKTL